ncbi:MAG TPA: SpoIID/LytB domain-containing protein [Vicinamibacterales bacterium]|nr:SpoIID/LytB domain-containing protein [Vicinamibacterales bacterium]
MTMRAGVMVMAAAALAGCAPGRPAAPETGGVPAIGETLRVQHSGRVETVPIDAYAAAVALTEIAPGAVPAAVADALYEAQIIVARTYAVSRRGRHGAEGFDLCDATHCQRYEPARLKSARWAELASRIASRTSRGVLVHDGRLIEAVFHADCGGHTADARDVWGAARPYLVAKRDAVKDPHREWTSDLDAGRLAAVLARDRRTRIDPPLRDLVIVRRDRSGRAARIRIAGPTQVEVDGDVFRAVVTAGLGLRALPSTRFTLRRQGDGWQLRGTGFGHGVGLCQAGALSRARGGAKGAEILGFYYPGAIIRRAPAR